MVNYAISKNIHVETEKENFSTSFFYFAFFSKLSKTSFAPFSPPFQIWSSWKFFWARLQVIWFFLDPLYQWSLTGFAKFWGSKKPRDFAKCSVFSWSIWNFWKKKRPSRLGPSTHRKNFSLNCGFSGGGGQSESMKMSSSKFIWQLLLYYSRSIYPFVCFLETESLLKLNTLSDSVAMWHLSTKHIPNVEAHHSFLLVH